MENCVIRTPNGSFIVGNTIQQNVKATKKIQLVKLLDEDILAVSKCFAIKPKKINAKIEESLSNSTTSSEISPLVSRSITLTTVRSEVSPIIQNISNLKKPFKLDRYTKAKNEESLISSINHPRAIKYIKTFEYIDPNTNLLNFSIIMEYSPNGNLKNFLQTMKTQKKRFTVEELLRNMDELIDLLANLQNKRISHRDIKPENVFVSKNNYFKLGDFGEGKDLRKSLASTLKGSRDYFSPLLFATLNQCVIKNIAPTVNHNAFKSDVYSLGLVFLYMVTLDPPEKITENRPIKVLRSLERLENIYIKFVLTQMLAIDEADRPDFVQLNEIMKMIRAFRLCAVCKERIHEVECVCPNCFYGFHSNCLIKHNCVTCKESLYCSFCGNNFTQIAGCSHKACKNCHCKVTCDSHFELIDFENQVYKKYSLGVCVICLNELETRSYGRVCLECNKKMCPKCDLLNHRPVSCVLARFDWPIRCLCGEILKTFIGNLFFECPNCGTICRYCFTPSEASSHLSCSKALN